MGELLARARAVVDQDERCAQAATQGSWRWIDPGPGVFGGRFKSALVAGDYPFETVMPAGYADMYPSAPDCDHIAAWDPARVLRLCANRRVLLDQYEAAIRRADAFGNGNGLISQAVVVALEPWVQAIADEGDDCG